MRSLVLAGCSALAALAVAAPAGAQTWTSQVGEQAKAPAGTPAGATLNLFFPAKLSVRAGDRVTFRSRGFHTVTFAGGAAPAPVFAPDPTGATYGATADAAGNPFFFAALTKIVYNVGAFLPAGSGTVDGSGAVSTGILAPGEDGKTATATWTFPKAGRYTILCLIHPGMTQTITVKPKRAKVAAPAAVKAEAAKETKKAWAGVTAIAKAPVPANTVLMGRGNQATVMGYFPARSTVKAGTTVRFVSGSTSEPHNVAFGPPEYIDGFMKSTDLFPAAPDGPNQASPALAYGTEGGPYVYTGANHGNGFMATPLASLAPGFPVKGTDVTFTTPGTYHFFCLLHGPEMAGDSTVTQ